VGPGVGPDDVDKRKFLTLSGLELRPFGRPARSQSLCYPGLQLLEANAAYFNCVNILVWISNAHRNPFMATHIEAKRKVIPYCCNYAP
jgi:hypothetical protein